VYSPDSLGFRLPIGATGTTTIKIRTPNGEATSTQDYTVGVPELVPTVTSFREYVGFNWIYVNGTNFVGSQTFIQIGDYETLATVYSPTSLGFTPNLNWIDSEKLIVTTPNGTAESNLEVLIDFDFYTVSSKHYYIEESTDLVNWTIVADDIAGYDGAVTVFTDLTNSSSKYFRITEK
jgi:hypothetical protein